MPSKVQTIITCFRCDVEYTWTGNRENAIPSGWAKFSVVYPSYTTEDLLCPGCLVDLNAFLITPREKSNGN